MGKTRNTGKLATQIQFDNSNNLVIGNSVSSSFNTSGSVNATGGITGSIFGIGDPTSFSASISSNLGIINNFTASNGNTSLNSFSASNGNDSLNAATSSYSKLSGGNTFSGTQIISGSTYVQGDLVVYGSSSIQYISASSVSIGTNIVQLNTNQPAVRYAGLSVQDSGSAVGVTGSMLWDSCCNRWIYSNPSGVGYSGGVLMSGPRAATFGTETTLTCNYIAKSGGGDHLYDSCIYESSGSVGIGTNVTDCYTGYSVLQVQGTTGAIIQTYDGCVKTALVSNSTGFGIVGTRTNHGLKIYTNDIERLHITCVGNVGIGTLSPTDCIVGSGTFIDISGTTGGGVKLHYSPLATYGELSVYKGSNGSYIDSAGASTVANNDLILRTGGTTNNFGVTERMRITNTGMIGINTSCPTSNGGLTVKRVSATGWVIDMLNNKDTRAGGFYTTGGWNGQMYLYTCAGNENVMLDSFGSSYIACGLRFGNNTSALNYYCAADWAPQFYAGGTTSFGLSSQTGTGRFTRIGNVVTLHGQISWTGAGSSGSLLSIQNLPWKAASNARGGISPGIYSGIGDLSAGGLQGIVEINTCIIYWVTHPNDGSGHTHLTGGAVKNNGSRLFSFGGSYITDDN